MNWAVLQLTPAGTHHLALWAGTGEFRALCHHVGIARISEVADDHTHWLATEQRHSGAPLRPCRVYGGWAPPAAISRLCLPCQVEWVRLTTDVEVWVEEVTRQVGTSG